MDTIELDVTQERIARGKVCNPHACPLAVAANDIYGGEAEVGFTSIYVKGQRYELPEDVEQRLVRYDTTKEMEPFSFTAKAMPINKPNRVTANPPETPVYALVTKK